MGSDPVLSGNLWSGDCTPHFLVSNWKKGTFWHWEWGPNLAQNAAKKKKKKKERWTIIIISY